MIRQGQNIFEGTNTLDSLNLFEERKEYKLFVDIPQSIDTWYRNPLYGKVNKKRNPVMLSESNLKQLPSDKTLFAIDFVTDAFVAMKNYYSQSVLQKRVTIQNTILKTLEAKKGWVSLNQLYHAHMNAMYNLFVVSYLKGARKEQEVKNFDDFVREFMSFAMVQKDLPFTKSGYILSNFCSSYISGLVIDIAIENNSSEDKIKQKFMEDPNYKYFLKSAKKFGFLVNKNKPWQLIANLNSAKMQGFAKKYGVEGAFITNFYDTYYYDVMLQDVDILKNYMIHFYNSYVVAYPNLRIMSCKGKTTTFKTSKRAIITNTNDLKDSLYWFRFYVLTRLNECDKIYDDNEKHNLLRYLIDLYTYSGLEKSLDYLNKQLNV
jgi:hypothetical protein